jgi:hypothetical protein
MRNVNRKGGKMDEKYVGPYTIAQVLRQNRVTLINKSGILLKTVYSTSQLKLVRTSKAANKPVKELKKSRSSSKRLVSAGQKKVIKTKLKKVSNEPEKKQARGSTPAKLKQT